MIPIKATSTGYGQAGAWSTRHIFSTYRAWGLVVLLLFAAFCGYAQDVPRDRVTIAELTPAASRSVEKGLAFLKHYQDDDGHWGDRYKVANTSLALLAFMVQGNVPKEEPYGKTMDRAITYLIRRSRQHGGYFADETSQVLYQHSFAMLAMAEVWGQSKRKEIGDVLKSATDILLRAQGSHGGWRYSASATGGHDLSCTVAAVQALASVKEAGIHVPEKAIRSALSCVRGYQDERTGFFNYGHGGGGMEHSLYRDGAGPLSLFLLGDHRSTVLKRGLSILRKYPTGCFNAAGHYQVAHFYATQASYQSGDSLYNYWYPRISEKLIEKQNADGSWTGGHDPSYATAGAILILGIPYRYLPIYQK